MVNDPFDRMLATHNNTASQQRVQPLCIKMAKRDSNWTLCCPPVAGIYVTLSPSVSSSNESVMHQSTHFLSFPACLTLFFLSTSWLLLWVKYLNSSSWFGGVEVLGYGHRQRRLVWVVSRVWRETTNKHKAYSGWRITFRIGANKCILHSSNRGSDNPLSQIFSS